MPIKVDGMTINSVCVADDDRYARRAMCNHVEDARLAPVEEPGPLGSLASFVRKVQAKSTAAIFDYKLRILGSYADFTGAQAVASLYRRRFPAILYTQYAMSDIDEMRPFFRFIPALLRPKEVDSDSIRRNLELCAREVCGHFSQTRRPWRTLVRVEEYDGRRRLARVVLPGWNPNEVIRLPAEALPESARASLRQGVRFHAYVNIGAESQEKLYITSRP
jgi:hypothetical protein